MAIKQYPKGRLAPSRGVQITKVMGVDTLSFKPTIDNGTGSKVDVLLLYAIGDRTVFTDFQVDAELQQVVKLDDGQKVYKVGVPLAIPAGIPEKKYDVKIKISNPSDPDEIYDDIDFPQEVMVIEPSITVVDIAYE